ncbi:hypothetical protein IWQ61_006860 [Dispira simplex]|nr:hypothetical protein IWQ61_006860 [Dispira simplex]
MAPEWVTTIGYAAPDPKSIIIIGGKPAMVSRANAESCSVRRIYKLSAYTSHFYQAYEKGQEILKKYPGDGITSLINTGDLIPNLLEVCKMIDEERSRCNPLKKLAKFRSSKCSKIRKISESTVQGQSLTETELPEETSTKTDVNVPTGSSSA